MSALSIAVVAAAGPAVRPSGKRAANVRPLPHWQTAEQLPQLPAHRRSVNPRSADLYLSLSEHIPDIMFTAQRPRYVVALKRRQRSRSRGRALRTDGAYA